MDTITSLRNPRVVAARKLDQRKHRQDQRRFWVEGQQALYMALDAGIAPHEVFYCDDMLTDRALLDRFRQTSADLVPVSEPVMRTLSDRDGPQGIAAVFPWIDTPPDALTLAGRELVLVLDRLQDPGNVGTLIRAADAVGAAAAVLIEPCADLYDPKAVRSSMGSIFNLAVVRTADVRVLDRLRDFGLRRVGADVQRGVLWGEGLWSGGVALVLGNEARGLSPDLYSRLDGFARLPMTGKAESLNVAVAGGVLLYAWLRANWD